jgi:amidohydrolase
MLTSRSRRGGAVALVLVALVTTLSAAELRAQGSPGADAMAAGSLVAELRAEIDREAARLEPRVIEWRRHFYANPELSNREFETAATVAGLLRDLGLEVRTGVAHTGVVGVLETGRPGPTVALRADMDALPVEDRSGVPFASTATGEYRGRTVPVMHACGHDTHIAMLLGAAEILAGLRDRLSGRVVFIFQPAEEGAPEGEDGGAEMMVREGVLRDPVVDAIFGVHIGADRPVGTISYREGGIMAAADRFEITVHGRQTHGSTPWTGVDPIVAAAQIITGLQTVVSRRTELTREAAVVTVGIVEAGVRNNIIPEKATLIGTIRTLDEAMQEKIHADVRQTATLIARSMGATADVDIHRGVPVTYNDPALTRRMLPSLRAVAGDDNVVHIDAITGAEDFSFFQQQVPGLYVFVGGLAPGIERDDAPRHHTPDFRIDEAGLGTGVRAHAYFAVDYLVGGR